MYNKLYLIVHYMMDYRIDRNRLFDRFSAWSSYLKRKVRLIACGGTAMTLLGIRDSTKDIDLIVPDTKEYKYLIGMLGILDMLKQERTGGNPKIYLFLISLKVTLCILPSFWSLHNRRKSRSHQGVQFHLSRSAERL